jgi:uncharacterized cupin superfamily protein
MRSGSDRRSRGRYPSWRAGEAVRWKARAGVFRRDVGDGEHAEIVIGEGVYRVLASSADGATVRKID